MNRLDLEDIDWAGIASVPKETLLILCGVVVALAVIAAICYIIHG